LRRIWIAAAAVLALAACSKPGKSVAVTTKEGEKVTVGEGAGPSHMPDYVKLYPGAKVLASVDNGAAGTISMESQDAPDKVLAFYRQQAAGAKLTSVTEVNESGAGGGHMLVFTGEGGKPTLSVTAQASDGKTTVGVTYGG
jgi:hypothetical protein